MNQESFDRLVRARCQLTQTVLAVKAKEYARGDRLHNFKRAAGFMNKQPTTACWGFMMKHLTSIADMVDDAEAGVLPGDAMMYEKIGDAINYLILLQALFEEKTAGNLQFGNFVRPVDSHIKKTKEKRK